MQYVYLFKTLWYHITAFGVFRLLGFFQYLASIYKLRKLISCSMCRCSVPRGFQLRSHDQDENVHLLSRWQEPTVEDFFWFQLINDKSVHFQSVPILKIFIMESSDKSVPKDNETKPETKENEGFVTDRLTNVGASTDNNNVTITNLYICSLVISPVLHIMDVGSDSYLAYQYYQQKDAKTYTYFLLTVTFIFFPAIITTIFSIRM